MKIITIICLGIIVACIINEAIHLRRYVIGALQEKRKMISIDAVRPLAFILLLSDFMQNSFEPVFANDLYSISDSILPKSLLVPCALSAEVFSVAVFSVFVGKLRIKCKLKNLLYVGALIAGIGFFIRGVSPTLLIFILGKIVTGAGMSMIFISLVTFIAERNDADLKSRGYAIYYAAYYTAINVGVVIGGYISQFLGYRSVYFISSLNMLMCIVFIFFFIRGSMDPDTISKLNKDYSIAKSSNILRNSDKTATLKFLLSKEIWSFFICIFAPILVIDYFLYYFYPIYADSLGVSGGLISDTYLINGLCVIVLGPILVPRLNKLCGTKKATLIGCLIGMAGIILFSVKPCLIMALVCILMLGIMDCICLSTAMMYYSELSMVIKYGEASSVGMTMVVENIATTAAPFIFSFLLLHGIQAGMTVAGVFYGICLIMFVVLNRKPVSK